MGDVRMWVLVSKAKFIPYKIGFVFLFGYVIINSEIKSSIKE